MRLIDSLDDDPRSVQLFFTSGQGNTAYDHTASIIWNDQFMLCCHDIHSNDAGGGPRRAYYIQHLYLHAGFSPLSWKRDINSMWLHDSCNN